MPINDLASLRQPRLRVLADGALIAAPITADIASNNHYAADRFHLTASLTQREAASWSTTPAVLIDIQIALQATDWTSLVQGEADHLTLDPVSRTLHLEGRDLTARLIETRTQETFANQTASDVATTLAGRHGLTAQVTQTTTPVGAYWQLEHDHITLDAFSRTISEWDLLITLARHEGFDVWVSGTTLHFRSPDDATTVLATLRPTATIDGPANVAGLRLERSLTLARDIEVVVKSWNSRQANAFSQTARAKGGTRAQGRIQRYVYVVPNLTPDAALKLAQSRLAEVTRHERVIHADMPGECTLTPRQRIRLTGTETDFDQVYWIDSIDRRLSQSHGFTQRLRARNVSAAFDATSPTAAIDGASWTES